MKVKKRHAFIFWFFKFLFIPFFYFRYKYTFKKFRNKNIKPPYLILSNHTSMMDQFLVSFSFNHQIYYVTAENYFNKSLGSRIMQYLVSPIPKSKGENDTSTIRNCLSIIKQKGVVGLFPTGNTTYSGREATIFEDTAKFVKFLKVPVLCYVTEGLYGIDPRWGKKYRHGKSHGEVKKVLMPSDFENLSNNEILNIIKENLENKELNPLNVNYNNRARAEYLERALWVCPVCKSQNCLHSKKHAIYCAKCGANAIYGKNLLFTSPFKEFDKKSVKDLFYFQLNFVKMLAIQHEFDNIEISENHKTVYKKNRGEKKKIIYNDCKMTLVNNSFKFSSKDACSEFKLDSISGIAIQGRNRLVLQQDGCSYIIYGQPRDNHYKFMQIYILLKGRESNYGILEL